MKIPGQLSAEINTEKVNTYEAGVKTTFRGAIRGTFNISGFYNDFKNQQLQINLDPIRSGVSPATSIFNAGASRIYGVEVEANIQPIEGLSIQGGYTYLNTKLKRFAPIVVPPGSPYAVNSAIRPGDQLALSPRNKFTVTGTYTLPLSEDVGSVSLSATFTHIDKQVSNYVNRQFTNNPSIFALRYIQPQNLLNLNLNWDSIAGSPIDLALFATNVTQKKYYSYVSGLSATVGFETAALAPPRMYGIRLRYNLGR